MNQQSLALVKSVIAEQHQWKIILLEQWPAIIGSLAPYVTIEQIKESVLFLGTKHPAWSQELSFILPELKEKINNLLSSEKITAIIIKHNGCIAERKKITREKKSQKPVIPERTLTILEQYHLSRIKDQELQTALKLFLLLSPVQHKE